MAAVGIATGVMWWQRTGTIPLEVGGLQAAALGLLVWIEVRRGRASGVVQAVLSSLGAYAQGTRESDCLSIDGSMGPLAEAYNALLDERSAVEAMRASSMLAGSGGRADDAGTVLQVASDAMWSGLMVFDRTGALVAMNGAAGVLLGITRGESIGSMYGSVLRDELVSRAVGAVCGGQSRRRETFELRRGDEQTGTWLRISVKPMSVDDGGAVVIIEDVTQQHAAEEARQTLVAHTVHELRTPLTNIRLYVEEAVEVGDNDPQRREQCLNVINHEARRLERVVADMLSVSEIEAGSLQMRAGDVRLDALFDDLKVDYEAAASEKGIGLSFVMPPKLPVLHGDREKLSVSLHNLIGNAIKYTPQGGAVVVAVTEESGWLVVKVSDTGIGIDVSEQERIFERFYRAADVRAGEVDGTGLGLTLAREVARLHGGDITVESEVEKGSTFTLRLPVGQRAMAA